MDDIKDCSTKIRSDSSWMECPDDFPCGKDSFEKTDDVRTPYDVRYHLLTTSTHCYTQDQQRLELRHLYYKVRSGWLVCVDIRGGSGPEPLGWITLCWFDLLERMLVVLCENLKLDR